MWDSRAQNQHYVNKGLPVTTELKPGDKDVIDNLLVSRDKIIFTLLLIKLGLMKHFVKAFNKEGKCFEYLGNSFTGISIERKWTTFDGLDIRKIVKDLHFIESTNDVDQELGHLSNQ